MADDVDVVWEGSPLYAHLNSMGMCDEAVEVRNGHDMLEPGANVMQAPAAVDSNSPSPVHDPNLLCSARSFMWPNEDKLALEVNVAKAILESELLVQEDEEFINNFILNEETMAEYQRLMQESPSRASSLLSDIVLFSSSLAAVTGAVLYLSEKAKAATFAAALLPSAVAAMTSVRIGTKVQQDKESEHFHKIVDLLLSDMKHFKQLVRKSLNLLQGMEMVSSGSYLSVDPSTGAATAPPSNLSREESKLVRALAGRTTFPALRQAARKSTIQIIEAYREAVAKLMEVSPLADHVDLREHYIAFVDLDNFNIEPSGGGATAAVDPSLLQPITVQELKETAQVALVQQSEYLRRFSLTFCERVRDDHEINKAGVLKHIRDLLSSIRKINNKLARVLEYHQSMGLDLEKPSLNKELAIRAATGGPRLNSLKFVPLRSIYTSMFSTGLHLQHSLLKLRQLEKLFDAIEKPPKKSITDDRSSPTVPFDEGQLLEWLSNFKDIQDELNACVGCLDEGVMQIDSLTNQGKCKKEEEEEEVRNVQTDSLEAGDIIRVDSDSVIEHFDEVFEAFISADESSHVDHSDIDFNLQKEKLHSGMVLRELKQVLVHKAREHEIREAQAIARQQSSKDPFGYPVRAKGEKRAAVANSFDDSFTMNNSELLEEDVSSSSSSSECATVKSVSPKRRSSLTKNDTDDELSSITESCSRVAFEDSEADYSLSFTAANVSSATYLTISMTSLNQHNGESAKDGGLSVRSVSTPDLNSITTGALGTYKHLANSNGNAHENHDDDTESSSSSEWGSADELCAKDVLKTFRRPLRPSAKPKHNSAGTKVERKTKMLEKRKRNRSNISYGASKSEMDSNNGQASTYARHHETADNPLSKPNQMLSGFQSAMAAEAANLARAFRKGGAEVIIGDDESSSDDD